VIFKRIFNIFRKLHRVIFMNDKKNIFAWCMYDWANSAFVLTVVTAVLPVYFADVIVPSEGYRIAGTCYSATTLWGFMISTAALFVFIAAPVLGAMADYTRSKKKFLMTFCYIGSVFTVGLFACAAGDVWLTMVLFIVAQIGFVAGNIFYDAFLPHIATPDKMDWVSGKGYAYGYVGSVIHLAVSLGLITFHEPLGIGKEMAVRVSLAFAGIWWGGFALITLFGLNDPDCGRNPSATSNGHHTVLSIIKIGFTRTGHTLKKIRSLNHLLLFLIGFMFYNEGIQTVIVMATIYGQQELDFSVGVLMITLLIVQVVAMGGALLFSKLSEKTGTKNAILISLVIWCGIVMYAYFMTTAGEYMILGLWVGIVLGGSQALSRSYYGSMIPADASAEFYGFYSVFTKFSSIWGPMVFGIIQHVTGSARLSIISLIAFFLIGMICLYAVNEDKARQEQRLKDPIA